MDGPLHKNTGIKSDYFLCGNICTPLLLRYGALGVYRTYYGKAIGAYRGLGLAESKDYTTEWFEVFKLLQAVVTMWLAGYEADVSDLLGAVGLSEYEGDGFEQHWAKAVTGKLVLLPVLTTRLKTSNELTRTERNQCWCMPLCYLPRSAHLIPRWSLHPRSAAEQVLYSWSPCAQTSY